MSEYVYKQIELTGSSPKSSDDAVRVALEKAAKTLRNMHWFDGNPRTHRGRQDIALAGDHQGRPANPTIDAFVQCIKNAPHITTRRVFYIPAGVLTSAASRPRLPRTS